MTWRFLLVVFFFAVSVYCQSCPATGCGNGVCDAGENCQSCPFDCGVCPTCEGICGNHLCEAVALENSCNCPTDCGPCCINGLCQGQENAANCPSDCTGTLTGYVYDVDTFLNIPNATVVCNTRFTRLTTSTAADGTFGLGGLSANYYSCTATAPGYLPGTNSINFQPGSGPLVNATLRIGLMQPPAMLVGWVKDGFGNFFLRGANVSCTLVGTENTFTNRVGYYFFPLDLSPGLYTCTAGAPMYSQETLNVTLFRGIAVQLNFTLMPMPPNLYGQVIDRSTGLPIVDALVICEQTRDQIYLPNTTSDSVGDFVHYSLLATQYVCTSWKVGYTRGIGMVCLMWGENGTMVLAMQPLPAVLQGVVLDQLSGSPLPGAVVTCTSLLASPVTNSLTTGAWSDGQVPPGTFTCSASLATYYPSLPQTVSLSPGQIGNLTFLLTYPPSSLCGFVTESTTNGVSPAVGAVVSCQFASGAAVAPMTVSPVDGSFCFLNTPLGSACCNATLLNFSPESACVTIPRSTNVTQNFTVPEILGNLLVNVTDQSTTIGIPNALIVCTSTPITYTANANGAGSNLFSKVVFTTYVCTGSAPGYASASSPPTVAPRNTLTSIVIPLAPLPGILIVEPYDTSDNQPLPGALITIGANSQTANGNGLTNWTLVAGTYAAVGTLSGYTSGSVSNIIVTRGSNQVVQVPLSPIPSNLTCNVIDSNGNPLPGAYVYTTGPLFANNQTAPSPSASIMYTITSYGVYTCSASLPGYFPSFSTSPFINRNTSYTLNVTLGAQPGTLTITAYDITTNLTIPNSNITLNGVSTISAPSGSAQWTVGAATYSAGATATGYSPGSTSGIVVLKGQSTQASIYLTPLPGLLTVNVVVTVGNVSTPLPGALVVVVGPAAYSSSLSAPSPGASLNYTITAFGSYQASCSLSGYQSATTGLPTDVETSPSISRAGSATLTCNMVPTPDTIIVTVVDIRTNLPIPGASVSLSGFLTVVSGSNASATFYPVAAGSYTAGGAAAGYSPNTTVATGPVVRNQTLLVTVYLTELPCTITVTVWDNTANVVVPNATVFLNDANHTTLTSNSNGVAVFSVLYNAATTVSAYAFGFYNSSADPITTCTRGGSDNITVFLNETIIVTLTAEDATSKLPLPFAEISWNGVLVSQVNPLNPAQRVLVLPFLPITGNVSAIASGFNPQSKSNVFFNLTIRSLIIQLAPQQYTLYFVPVEVFADGTVGQLPPGLLNNNYVPPVAANSYIYQSAQITVTGSIYEQPFPYSSSSPLSSSGYVYPTVWNSTDPTFLGPQPVTYYAAKYTQQQPTSSSPFYLQATNNMDNYVVNNNNSVNASFELMYVPDYAATQERNLLFFLPYKLNAGFITVRVWAITSTFQRTTFGVADFVGCTLNSRLANQANLPNGIAMVIFDYNVGFNTQVTNITFNYDSGNYDSVHSNWFYVQNQNQDSSNGNYTVLPPGQGSQYSTFSWPTPEVLANFVALPNGQVGRDSASNLYILRDFGLIKIAKKKK